MFNITRDDPIRYLFFRCLPDATKTDFKIEISGGEINNRSYEVGDQQLIHVMPKASEKSNPYPLKRNILINYDDHPTPTKFRAEVNCQKIANIYW